MDWNVYNWRTCTYIKFVFHAFKVYYVSWPIFLIYVHVAERVSFFLYVASISHYTKKFADIIKVLYII